MAGINSLSPLIGLWHGRGTAKFPTIETTEYIEELSFERMGDEDKLFFIQKTWYSKDGKKGNALHWESGYIKLTEENLFELSNSQDNGRVEVLTGNIVETSDKFHISFVSKLFGNDPRMVKSSRDFYVHGSTLKYTQSMSTQKTTEFQLHLEADLKKV